MRLENKVAVVTGASSGLGQGIARMFRKEGAWVVCADLHPATDPIEDENVVFCQADVSSSADADRMIALAVEKFGRVDILVNCAGIGPTGAITEYSDETWNKVIGIDLTGTFYCLRAAVRSMKEKQVAGSIINLSSIMGLVAFPNSCAYCSAKGGVSMLTKEAALELAQDDIRVNAIAPAVVRTPLTEKDLSDPATQAYILGSTPLGKLGEVEDVAYAALYLASEESKYVTGTVLYVDGGWTAK